ncbi:hypothetical protein QFZ49_002242 [Streptomyces turgidiscabies]|uniref:Uncharacterized protein n=1 Tax=Streptomyces turgidiscabies TaxID=85558 RepID=A0ABU0RMC4_9ACTN|nr:hypothetical protein [Streptomyces turgidiscabies]
MDIRAVVTGFRGAEPLPGLPDSWHWSPAHRIDFAGALSADGKRLLQLSGRDSYDQDLAVSTLRFARDHEDRSSPVIPFWAHSTASSRPPAIASTRSWASRPRSTASTAWRTRA